MGIQAFALVGPKRVCLEVWENQFITRYFANFKKKKFDIYLFLSGVWLKRSYFEIINSKII